jgi:hypothetical protein
MPSGCTAVAPLIAPQTEALLENLRGQGVLCYLATMPRKATWKERIQRWEPKCSFGQPVAPAALASAERSLGVALPEDLKKLLCECDGFTEPTGGFHLVWPAQQIESENLQFRSNPDFRELYMPFDHLLFFGEAGDGDQFAFPICDGAVRRADVFVWNHEDDSRSWVAPRLETYVEWWLGARIP